MRATKQLAILSSPQPRSTMKRLNCSGTLRARASTQQDRSLFGFSARLGAAIVLDRKLSDEHGRIAALRQYDVLDSAAEQPFDNITELVRAVLQVPICAVTLIDRDRQWFKSSPGLEVRQTPKSASFCAHTIKTHDPMIVPDMTVDERFSDNPLVVGPPYVRSYVGAPLRSPGGYNLGALAALDTVSRTFDESQISILKNLAAVAVEELELRRIANRDYLTGALTRRGFFLRMKTEIERFRRFRRPSVLLLLDIDHFKLVNDRLGHPAGDKVLQAVADCCCAIVRSGDSFGRLGGEEFGLLLSETSAQEGLFRAERCRRAIANLRFPAHESLRVSASFGVTPMDISGCDPEHWLECADEALYQAKRSGRNRSVLSNDVLHVAAA